jgi:FlaA1/EpsC-like NDP-sugar epimerase
MNYFNKRIRDKNFLLLLVSDLLIITTAFCVSVLFRYEFIFPTEVAYLITPLSTTTFIITKILSFKIFGLYKGMWRYTSVWDMMNIFKGNLFASLLIISGVYIISSFEGISRAIFVLDLVMCSMLIGSSRLGIRLFFSHFIHVLKPYNKKSQYKNVILIGAGDTSQNILRQTLQTPESLIKITGIISHDQKKVGHSLHGIPIVGTINSLSTLNIDYDEAYICLPSADRKQMLRIVEECKKTKKPFKTLPSISELVQGKVSISQFREVSLLDLLGREEVELNKKSINNFIEGKRVLVTGGGGSIGSELVRQCIKYNPSVLVMLDISELNIFEIDRELISKDLKILFKPVLADIRDCSVLDQVFMEFKPQVVFHAAAYKHVPMQEYFPWEAIKTNVIGTDNVSKLSINYGVEKFVLVSTDKAVKPANVMGATKRLAEIITQDYNRKQNNTEFMAVRFGNVLGSSGSVIPIFQEQIKNGGPVTVTDPDMERYFMSIPEASQLILQAGSIGIGGEVFILDMGDPIKIIDIASELIRLSGYVPDLDIPIEFTGTRPGEKKIEELSLPTEQLDKTKHDKIFVLNDSEITNETISKVIIGIKGLEKSLSGRSANQIRSILSNILPEYNPELSSKEPIYIKVKNTAEA